MKKKYLSVLTATFIFWFIPLYAQSGNLRETLKGSINTMRLNVAQGDPYTIIGTVLKSLFGLLGVIFFILMIAAGILWMTSAGNENKIAKAKGILLASILGILIIFTSYIVTIFVITLLRPS